LLIPACAGKWQENVWPPIVYLLNCKIKVFLLIVFKLPLCNCIMPGKSENKLQINVVYLNLEIGLNSVWGQRQLQ
jgi:hypothetical protein